MTEPSTDPSGGAEPGDEQGPSAASFAAPAPSADGRCDTCWNWDPLASTRSADDRPLDVILSGTVFYDLVFSGLSRMPNPGEELWSEGLGSSPGGIANLATAAARLGLRTGLAAGFGDDAMADWMWDVLADQEGIDLSASKRFADFHSPITVAISTDDDRAMVTHGHHLPESLDTQILAAPSAKAALVDLAGEHHWWEQLAARGTKVWADIGFDSTGAWDVKDLDPLEHCYAFTPNSVEAMAYTRTESPSAAARALSEKVGLAIVTDGARGVYAIDGHTGEEAYCPALSVPAVDPTGAGDVFAAASVLGDLAGWPLMQRLRFASLCSAIAVQQHGGALAAPGWADLTDWWRTLAESSADGDLEAAYVAEKFAFLDGLVPRHETRAVHRAEATFRTHHQVSPSGANEDSMPTERIRVDRD
ncbi:carbohydrate kinase family protein [Helcobacillus massiliensis]|uniref:Sugar/nucleoside kinase (Ribokinase family) n=1 Tax=Helcobacillus massiliensis TaxID=521392 RepID=A0A839R156_9MICO|nr:PfkB family carbohydrate kinase [Helcobacillus massiliensis]MBB3023577.1 sugar/nucleoside kinase (ribokinase family) [Helcobacillus massiliensis]